MFWEARKHLFSHVRTERTDQAAKKNRESSTIDSKEKEEEEKSIFFVLKNAPRLQRSNEWISFRKKLSEGVKQPSQGRSVINAITIVSQSFVSQSARALKLPSK